MLYAVGIASAIARDGSEFILLVDVDDAPAAGEHLHLYEQERLVQAAAAASTPEAPSSCPEGQYRLCARAVSLLPSPSPMDCGDSMHSM